MRFRIPVVIFRLGWPVMARCGLVCAAVVACLPAAVTFAQQPPKADVPLKPVQQLIADLDAVVSESADRDQVIVDESSRLSGEVVGKSISLDVRFVSHSVVLLGMD